MIIYKDILGKLKEKGYNTNKLRLGGLLPESTIQAIRNGQSITIKSVDTICKLLRCQPGDIMEYVPDQNTEE